jgi:chemotaxis protein methyltransferase CheR
MLPNSRLKYFSEFIEKELGIVYSEQVSYQLQQRLEKVAEYLGLKDPEALYTHAITNGINGNFRAYLLDIATNNETSFFRDPSIYGALESFIFPNLKIEYPGAFNYRIWSAAASFGQEPYSLAMLSYETREKDPLHPRIEIKATDISDQALKRCQNACYTQLEVQRGLSSSRLIKYFFKNEVSDWILKPEISSIVDFSKRNLLDSFTSMGKFHIILCRYVLIYQDAVKKKDILNRLVQCLHPKGYLIMGGSESAMGLSSELEQVDYKGAVFYRKK